MNKFMNKVRGGLALVLGAALFVGGDVSIDVDVTPPYVEPVQIEFTPKQAFAVPSSTPVQVCSDTGTADVWLDAGTDCGGSFSAPSSGNIILLLVSGQSPDTDNVVFSEANEGGFTKISDATYEGTGNAEAKGGWLCKLSTGAEDHIKIETNATTSWVSVTLIELSPTDLDTDCSNVLGSRDIAEVADTGAISVGTGTVVTTVNDAVACYGLSVYQNNEWDTTDSIDSGTLADKEGASSTSRTVAYCELLSASGSNSATGSTTDSGGRVLGTQVVIQSPAAGGSVSFDAASYEPGDTVTATLTGYTNAPEGAYETSNGTFLPQVTSNTSTMTFQIPPRAQFTAGGDAAKLQMETLLTFEVPDGGSYLQDFTDRDLTDDGGDISSFFARTGNQTGVDLSGNLEIVTSGAAYDGSDGILLEISRQNGLNHSHDFDSETVTERGTGDVTYQSGVAGPDGTNGVTEVTVGATNTNDVFTGSYGSVGTSGDPIAMSFWMKKNGQTGVLNFQNPRSTAAGEWDIDTSAVGSGWERITKDHAAVTVNTAFQVHTDGGGGWWFGCDTASSCTGSFYVSYMQMEVDASYVTSEIKTEGSAVTRNVTIFDDIDLVDDLSLTDIDNGMAVHVIYKAAKDSTDCCTGAQETILDIYGTGTNWLNIYEHSSAQRVQVEKLDGGVATYAWVTDAWSKGDVRSLVVRTSSADGLKMWLDGTTDEDTTANAKSDWDSSLTTLDLGYRNGAFPGSNVIQCVKVWDYAPPDSFLEGLGSTACGQ